MSVQWTSAGLTYTSRFDRASGLLTLSTDDYTFCCWIRRSATGVHHAILGRSGQSNRWELFVNTSDKLAFLIGASGSIAGTTTLASGTWYHVAVTRESNIHKIYVNGVVEATINNSSGVGGDVWYIGGEAWAGEGFYGYIESLKEWNQRALSAAELVTEMNSRIVVSSTNLYSAYGWQSIQTSDDGPNGFTLTERNSGNHSSQSAVNPPYSSGISIPVAMANYRQRRN